MENNSLIFVCFVAFVAVMTLLTFLGLLIHVIVRVFPFQSDEPEPEVARAIQQVVQEKLPGARLVRVREIRKPR